MQKPCMNLMLSGLWIIAERFRQETGKSNIKRDNEIMIKVKKKLDVDRQFSVRIVVIQ